MLEGGFGIGSRFGYSGMEPQGMVLTSPSRQPLVANAEQILYHPALKVGRIGDHV